MSSEAAPLTEDLVLYLRVFFFGISGGASSTAAAIIASCCASAVEAIETLSSRSGIGGFEAV